MDKVVLFHTILQLNPKIQNYHYPHAILFIDTSIMLDKTSLIGKTYLAKIASNG